MAMQQNNSDDKEMECHRCGRTEDIEYVEQLPGKGLICEQCAPKASLNRLLITGRFARDPVTGPFVRDPVTKMLSDGKTWAQNLPLSCGCVKRRVRTNPRQQWGKYLPLRWCETHRPRKGESM